METQQHETASVHDDLDANHLRTCRQCQQAKQARIFGFVAELEELYSLNSGRCSATMPPPRKAKRAA